MTGDDIFEAEKQLNDQMFWEANEKILKDLKEGKIR
jgi:hypothetical protein